MSDKYSKNYFIIDTFMFHNEFELLKARMSILKDVVDVHLLVEGNRTFQGAEKPLYFQESGIKHDRLYHAAVNLPHQATPWQREAAQRIQTLEYLQFMMQVNGISVVLLSDVDEIPHPDAVLKLRTANSDEIEAGKVVGFHQNCYYYYADLQTSFRWIGTKAQRIDEVINLQALRDTKTGTNLEPYGWHFSFLGNEEAIRNKIASYSHSEYNIPDMLDNINKNVKERQDLFGR